MLPFYPSTTTTPTPAPDPTPASTPTAPSFLAGTVVLVVGNVAQVRFVGGVIPCEIPDSLRVPTIRQLNVEAGDVVIVTDVLYGDGPKKGVQQISRKKA